MSPRTVPSLEEVAKEVESHEVEFQPVEVWSPIEGYRTLDNSCVGSLIMQ